MDSWPPARRGCRGWVQRVGAAAWACHQPSTWQHPAPPAEQLNSSQQHCGSAQQHPPAPSGLQATQQHQPAAPTLSPAAQRGAAPWYLRLSVEFQWFFTALSVRPGSSLEMTGGRRRRWGGRRSMRVSRGAPALHQRAGTPMHVRLPGLPHCCSTRGPTPRRARHSRAHLLPCSRCALMITASSHWLNGSFFTSGFSWLHHLRRGGGRAAGAGGWVGGCWRAGAVHVHRARARERRAQCSKMQHQTQAPKASAAAAARGGAPHLRRQLLPERPRMPLAMMDQFLGPYSPISWRSSSSSCGRQGGWLLPFEGGGAGWAGGSAPPSFRLPGAASVSRARVAGAARLQPYGPQPSTLQSRGPAAHLGSPGCSGAKAGGGRRQYQRVGAGGGGAWRRASGV